MLDELTRLRRIRDYLKASAKRMGYSPPNDRAELKEVELAIQRLEAAEQEQTEEVPDNS